MTIALGTTPSSWGVWFAEDPRQPAWQQYLDEAAEAGYEWIELGAFGYLPTDPETLVRELDRRRLRVSAGHTREFLDLRNPDAWTAISRQVVEVGQLLAAVGARFLVVLPASYRDPVLGTQTAPATMTDGEWATCADMLHRIADLAHDRYGLEAVFHPHIETPVEWPDQIERLLSATDPQRVRLCLDTGHSAYRGIDPVPFLARHHARIPYLHVKDMDARLHQQVQSEGASFGDAVRRGVFCEPPTGCIDFVALRNHLRALDRAMIAIVEQGMFPLRSFDIPLPIARRTRAYFRDIGLG